MTLSQTPPPTGNVLPVFEIVGEALRTFTGHIGKLPAAAAWPFMLSAALVAIESTLGEAAVLRFVVQFAALAIYTLFAVAWHRLMLTGESPRSSPAAWSPAHTAFFLYLLAFEIFITVIGLLMAAMFGIARQGAPETAGTNWVGVIGPVTLAMLIVYFVAVVRCSFVFPARAVGERYGVADSWRNTAGNFWRLVGIWIVIGIIIAVPMWMCMFLVAVLLPISFDPSSGIAVESWSNSFMIGLAFTILSYLAVGLGVTTLSIAFRRATGWVPAPLAT